MWGNAAIKKCTFQRLEEVLWAWGAWGQSCVGVCPWLAFGPALVDALRSGLEGEGSLRARGALLESVDRWGAREGVLGAFQTGHQARGAVGPVAAHWDAIRA